ncbi:MAG: acyl-CoA desaturase [Candidatus Methylopumilus sp.]|nr:acyl-CoA desaturase [Candidatus Methylopumilus sp.]
MKFFKRFFNFFDNSFLEKKYASLYSNKEIDWIRVVPFILLHVSCLFVFVVGFSSFALVLTFILFATRMFAITGFYHRYFSHKTYRTSRVAQCVFAIIGATAVQRGPLWWAAHHRGHHMHSDTSNDKHSPNMHGFFWSHMGWFLSKANFVTNTHFVRELIKFPELRIIDRFDLLMPATLLFSLFFLGQWMDQYYPEFHTNGYQLVIWGFSISTVILYHATFLVNSVAHQWGKKRYHTKDASRNNFIVALITFGEGWHNNHHHFPGSARQGFYWWEIDLTYYGLKVLSMLGIIWDIRTVSPAIRESKKIASQIQIYK